MKRNWLNITEYLLLVGTGVGSVAAAVAVQPLLFTAAPMSALLLLNLINRRRGDASAREDAAASVAHLDQKLSTDIAALQQQVQVLPNFLDLASLRKSVLTQSEENLDKLAQEVNQIKREITKPEWRLLRQEMRQLQEQYAGVADTLGGITNQLHRMTAASRVDGLEDAIAQLKSELSHLRVNLQNLSDEQRLNNNRNIQEQIDHLNRRLNKLPTPFDASSLKQDIDSLVKMMGDMVSRRELAKVTAQVEKLHQQSETFEQSMTPLKVATAILKKQLDTLHTKVTLSQQTADNRLEDAFLHPSLLDNLRATVTSLEQRLNQLPANADLPTLKSEVQGMVATQMGPLQQQLSAVHQLTQSIDRQQKSLRDWVNRLPQVLDTTALQNEVKYLAARVEWAENNAMDMQAQVEATVKSQLTEVTQQLQANQSANRYELVFDVKGGDAAQGFSRYLLEDALEKAQARLIVVYPFPNPETLNSAIIEKFRVFLNRKGCLDIGWGHLGDMANQHVPRSIDRRRTIDSTEQGFLYETLNQLTQLKRQYPDQFRFKVLGTSENFLVCDRSFAILGAQSIATASVVFPQAAVGLRATDAEVIQGLVERFDNPALDANDADAYFSRASTRYDLGDRQGAIADYSEVIRIQPHDDVAYTNRGLARYDLGDRPGAMEDFAVAIHHNPQNYIAFFNRGFVRSELEDKLGAIEDYTFALQINPDYSTGYFHRGLARTRMQNKLGAIQDYNEVIRLNPQDATAYFYRGLALIKIGHRQDAVIDLHQAAQLFYEQGDEANYQQVIRMLKKLQKMPSLAEADKPMVSNGA